MPQYYQTGSGYCYKKYANGTCKRVSENEYTQNQLGSGGIQIGGGQLGAGMYRLGMIGGGNPQQFYHANHKKTISGAGVIFLENYKGKWAVVLIQNKWTKKYEEMGGTMDDTHHLKVPKNPAAQTAKEEVNEESRNLIAFESSLTISSQPSVYHDFTNKAGKTSSYRCYFARIPSGTIYRTDFSNNKKILDKLNKNQYGHYQETLDLTRVYLSDLSPLLNQRGDVTVRDVYGSQIIVSGRTKACLRIGSDPINNKVDEAKTNAGLSFKKIVNHTKGPMSGTKTIIFQ